MQDPADPSRRMIQVAGTPYYMAPEIWKYQKYGKESDIWALGVILYEICCLQYPFPANELDELEKKVINDKI